MKKLILLFLIISVFLINGCESSQVKNARKEYKKFLYEMSDKPEYLTIISEKVKVVGEFKSETFFYVDYETKYSDKILKDKIEIYFLGESLTKINGISPLRYKTDYLLNIIENK